MNVELTVVGKVIVDDQRHCLYVNPTSPHISCDQHTTTHRREQWVCTVGVSSGCVQQMVYNGCVQWVCPVGGTQCVMYSGCVQCVVSRVGVSSRWFTVCSVQRVALVSDPHVPGWHTLQVDSVVNSIRM